MDYLKNQIDSDLKDLREDCEAGLFKGNEPARQSRWSAFVQKVIKWNHKEELKPKDLPDDFNPPMNLD